MKKFLSLLFLFGAMVLPTFAQDEPVHTCLFGENYNKSSINNYTSTWETTNDDFTWSVSNFNNNNNGWEYVRCGSKSTGSGTASVTTSSAISDKISKVVLTGCSNNKVTNATVTLKLLTSTTNDNFTKEVGSVTYNSSNPEETVTFEISQPEENLYYQLYVDWTTNTNGCFQLGGIEYYAVQDESKLPAGLSFDAQTVDVEGLNSSFTSPKLTKSTTANVTYTSSDTAVATVNETSGEVTIVNYGTTTITATAASNDQYNGGSASYKIVVTPDHILTVTEAVALIKQNLKFTATVEGIISSITSKSVGNQGGLTYYIKDNLEATDQIQVYYGLYVNGEKFTSVDQIAVGGQVQVKGNLLYYQGTTPEIDQNSIMLSYEAPTNIPDAPTEVINVAEAIAYIKAGGTAEISVEGIISQIDSFNDTYGSITYWISDDGTTTNQLEVYGGLSLNGEKFASKESIVVGAEVVVKGEVTNYQGTTPEFSANSVLVSYLGPNGETEPSDSTGETTPPTGNDVPEPEAGKPVVFDFTKYSYGLPAYNAETNNAEYVKPLPATITYGNVVLTLNGQDASKNNWRFWSDGLRAYSAGSPYFTVSTADGQKVTYVTWTVANSNLEIEMEGTETPLTQWEGDNASVTFVPVNKSGNNAIVTLTVAYGDIEYTPLPDTTNPDEGDGEDEPGEDEPGDDEPGETQSQSVTFNFADPTSLEGEFDGSPISFAGTEAEYNVTDVTFLAGPITVTGTAPEDATNAPRLFLSTGNNPAWSYRFYKDNEITIAATDSCYISKIEFVATNLGNESIVFEGEGTFTNNVWTATEGAEVTEVVITKTATGNNPVITSMTVYYTGTYTAPEKPVGNENTFTGETETAEFANGDTIEFQWSATWNKEANVTFTLTLDSSIENVIPQMYIDGEYVGDFTQVTSTRAVTTWEFTTSQAYSEDDDVDFAVGFKTGDSYSTQVPLPYTIGSSNSGSTGGDDEGEGDTSAVSSLGSDNDVEAEYYTLQGLKVKNPAKGQLYIVRKGDKVSKVIVR